MSKKKVTRRGFIKSAGTIAGVAALQACAPKAEPTAVPPTAVPATAVPAPTATPVPTPAPTGPKHGGLLTHRIDADITWMDPQKGIDVGAMNFIEQVYEGLCEYDEELNVVPGIAEWETPDDLTYIWRLREGVKFHDGQELEAEDVKYTVDYILDPDNGIGVRGWYSAIEDIEVIDKYTVKMNLNRPDPGLAGAFAIHRYEGLVKAGAHDNDNQINREPNGTGPFKLKEYVSASHYEFERHGDYWKKDIPYVDGMLFKIMPEEEAAIAALTTGQIDHTSISPEGYLRVKDDPNLNVVWGPIASNATAEFNPSRTFPDGSPRPWADKRVRQALSYATDRQEIIEKVQNGFGEMNGVILRGYGDWWKEPKYEYNLDKAKQLLKEAGWGDGFELTFMASPGIWGGALTANAVVLAAQWKKVGVECSIEQPEWAVAVKRMTPEEPAFDYDVSFTGHSYRPDPVGFFDVYFHADPEKGGWNPGYDNPRVNELLTSALVELDREKRKAMYSEAEDIILYDECWWIQLYLRAGFEAMQLAVKGFVWDIRAVFDRAKYLWLDR